MKRELPRPCLMLVTEPHPQLTEIVAAAVAGGVNVVQWREYPLTPARDEELFLLATAMRTASLGALLHVNGPRVILSSDGCHVRSFMPYDEAVPAAGRNKLAGQSVHSVSEAIVSAQSGFSYLVAGTIFPSQSHPEVEAQGVNYLHDVCQSVSIPVIAIGGITTERVAACVNAGAAGIAVLSTIMRAQDPHAAAQEYCRTLDRAWVKYNADHG